MRKFLILMLVIFSLWGCGQKGKKKAAIKIGKIEVTAQEFEEAFNLSSFAQENSSAKKEFLDTFISRKLILKEAEREGLDKDPEFLRDVQLFWEQSLLKLMLSRKMKSLSTHIKVGEDEIRRYYSMHKDKEFSHKPLVEVRDKIKWFLFNQKQKQALQDWINSLKRKTRIDIDYKALNITER
ncbi:MAG: hypothetical protein B6D56_02455 [Candidatus Omnitrophica bacterium 4484_70.1]|nr:MAG: hypothetical protein B6D56_02455 [Candidatus Omnitrophica bacterium 4484_70.1]